MCTCTHGRDRHYLDYAGPGIAGGILTKCLAPGCGCRLFQSVGTVIYPAGTTVHPTATITIIPSNGAAGQGNAGAWIP